MKTLLLITALCLTAMAQEQKPPESSKEVIVASRLHEVPQAVKDVMAERVEQARSFAERAVADPSIIATVALANRATVLSSRSIEVMHDRANLTAEQLYQIQEEFGLLAAVRMAQILNSLPTLNRKETK